MGASWCSRALVDARERGCVHARARQMRSVHPCVCVCVCVYGERMCWWVLRGVGGWMPELCSSTCPGVGVGVCVGRGRKLARVRRVHARVNHEL